MKIVVVGLGQFGWPAALAFAKSGAETVALDIDMDLVDRIKDQVSHAARVDAANLDELKPHGIAQADILVAAIGANFEAQTLLVVHAKELGVRRVVARANSATHARILRAVGADEVLNPEEEAARSFVERTFLPRTERVELAPGFAAVRLHVPPGLAGRTLRALQLREEHRVRVVLLQPAAEEAEPITNPGGDVRVSEGDELLVVGTDEDLTRVGQLLMR